MSVSKGVIIIDEASYIDPYVFYNDNLRGYIQSGRLLYLNDPANLRPKCVQQFLQIKHKAQRAVLAFIWCIEQQNILPNELIQKIAEEIWESRQQEPALWLHA